MDSNSPPPLSKTNNTDIWEWLQSLPPLSQWKQPSLSTSLNSSPLLLSLSQPSPPSTALRLTVSTGDLPLWASTPLKELGPTTSPPLPHQSLLQTLFLNILHDFLNYNPNTNTPSISFTTKDIDQYSFLFDNLHVTTGSDDCPSSSSLNETFNLAVFSISFIACVHKQEAPFALRSPCLMFLKGPLSGPSSHALMRAMGATLEERWMRSLNLAITTLEAELDAISKSKAPPPPPPPPTDDHGADDDPVVGLRSRCPSPLFSKAMSKSGMWKVQVYCPLSAMEVENSTGTADAQLMFSLNHHHLEVVVQLNYEVVVRDKWLELLVFVDNVRLNVVALVKACELKEKGAGSLEKHFPSRISLQLTPSPPSADVLSVSVSKSSDNPIQQIGHDSSIQGSLEPTAMPGLHVSSTSSTTTTLKPWKFEQSAPRGDTGSFCWFLHDSTNGREVFASRPSLWKQLFQPRAWFKNRYSSAYRPFTRQGGVVFAKDEYGDQAVCWKVDKAALGRRMRWEVKGSVGLTYWPNQCRTLYNENRKAEFKDTFHLTLN